jgi:hypothetical protein
MIYRHRIITCPNFGGIGRVKNYSVACKSHACAVPIPRYNESGLPAYFYSYRYVTGVVLFLRFYLKPYFKLLARQLPWRSQKKGLRYQVLYFFKPLGKTNCVCPHYLLKAFLSCWLAYTGFFTATNCFFILKGRLPCAIA